MRKALIVSPAGTPSRKVVRGAFNDASAQELAGHPVREAVLRANIDAAEVDHVILGSA